MLIVVLAFFFFFFPFGRIRLSSDLILPSESQCKCANVTVKFTQ